MTATTPAGPTIVPFAAAPGPIDGLAVITIKQITEERGTIRELFRASALDAAGLPAGPWQQINVTESRRAAIRGLHGEAMTKLVAIVHGSALGAYVDARPESPTFGVVATVDLVPGVQVLVPAGVCNGFQTTSETSLYTYCFDREWVPGMTGVAVNPLDPALGLDWPIPVSADDRAAVSAKDAGLPAFATATGGTARPARD